MSSAVRPVSEAALNKSMNDLAQALVRELAMACKKTGIYGGGHPLATRALDKPLLILTNIFTYKRYVNLNVQRGRLFVLNIAVKDTVFDAQILHFMQLLDINALVFEHRMTMKEFSIFIESVVKRDRLYDPNFSLSDYLKEQGVDSIQVNTELAFDLFENSKQYRGEFDGDFSIKRFVLDQLGNELVRLVRVSEADSAELLALGIDFEPDVVRYLLPERVAALDPGEIRAALVSLVEKINDDRMEQAKRDESVDLYIAMFRLIECHPDRDQIIENLDAPASAQSVESECPDPNSATGAIKIESRDRVEHLLDELLSPEKGGGCPVEFADAFHRLLTTGQQDRAQDVAARLIELLGSPSPDFRQIALDVLVAVLDRLRSLTDDTIMASIVHQIGHRLKERQETYEYSELIWKLFQKGLEEKKYDHLIEVTEAMAGRRQVDADITVYDSMAIKKAFENINHTDVIDKLLSELIKAKHEEAARLRTLLISIGSEEVALALSSVISHPVRNVRQQALKILAELGKPSLKVCARILVNDAYFERDPDRHELPDNRWYVVRNAIFLLGLLQDPGGITPLRLRLSDPDVRVRREIVSAIEKIGGEDAVDCLIFMAEDPDREIRESSIIAIGLTGSSDTAPLLIDLVRRTCNEALKTVTSLGRLGGNETRAFLCSLLEDEKVLSELAGGKVSKEDLRVAVVRALGQIGDQQAIDKIKQFQASQSTSQKLFFKNSAVNKAIAEVLSRH